jgi:hypothetical protein
MNLAFQQQITNFYQLLNLADIYILYNRQLTTHNGQLTTNIACIYEFFGGFQPGTFEP